jgi:hypothetical protein
MHKAQLKTYAQETYKADIAVHRNDHKGLLNFLEGSQKNYWVVDTLPEKKKYATGTFDFIRKDSALDSQESWDRLTTHALVEAEYFRLENLGFQKNPSCSRGFSIRRKVINSEQELTEQYKHRLKETLGWVDVAPVPVESKSAKKRRLQEVATAMFAEAEVISDEEEGEEEVLARSAKRAKHQN